MKYGLIIAICGVLMGTAVFANKPTYEVRNAMIGPQGGTLKIEQTGTPLDGFKIEVPPGAFERETRLGVGYRINAITPKSGTPSKVSVIIQTKQASTQENAFWVGVDSYSPSIIVHIHCDPEKWAGFLPVPYRIEADGKLSPVDLLNWNKETGDAAIAIAMPMELTWIYTIDPAGPTSLHSR